MRTDVLVSQVPWLSPYDPTESPGPIPSVVDRFRPRGSDDEPMLTDAEIEAARYTIVLIPPELAEELGHGRCDAGLHMYRDRDWDHVPACLDEAAKLIQQECGEPVTLIEHRSDLSYWTARVRSAD